MSTPPPLPSVDYTAIADLHTAGAASTTLAPPLFNFIRKGVFDTERFVKSQENLYSTEEMSKFDAKFQKEVCFNFSATCNTQRKLQRQERSSRSSATINLNSVDDGTSDYRDLSRYILEDLLRCKEGTTFLLCLPTAHGDILRLDLPAIAKQQLRSGHGGEKVRLSGKDYYSFRVTMDHCPLHSEFDTETGMSQSRFITLYENNSGGFRVSFDGVPGSKLMLSWKSIVESATEYIFFGLAHASNRPMDYLFYRKHSLQWCHHILRHFSEQYYGDIKQSSLLLAAYHKARAVVFEKREKEAMLREAGLFNQQTLLTDEGKAFINVFDNHCRHAFYDSITSFQNYSQPLILVQDWENFIDVAKFVFEKPWRLLMSFRNIRHDDSPELINYKERQVFCQILSLIRAANPKYLTFWSLIITTAYYGWGVRGSAIMATSFWGFTCSQPHRDRMYSELLSKIGTVRKAVLRKQLVCLFCFDNIVVVQRLLDQRGRSSKVLTATHMPYGRPLAYHLQRWRHGDGFYPSITLCWELLTKYHVLFRFCPLAFIKLTHLYWLNLIRT